MNTKWKYVNPWYIPALIIILIAFILYPFSWLIMRIAYLFSDEKRPAEINEEINAKNTTLSQ